LDNNRRQARILLDECPERMRRFEWRYLRGLLATPRRVILNVGPTVRYSLDGPYIYAAGGGEPTIKVFDATTYENLFNFPGPTSWISPVDVSPDGHTVVSGCTRDRSVRLWNAHDGAALRLLGHLRRDPVETLFSRDGKTVLAVDRDRVVYAWDVETGQQIGDFSPQLGQIRAVAVSPVGSRVAVSAMRASQSSLTIWDYRSGKRLDEVPSAGVAPSVLAFSPDGALLAAAEPLGPIRIWTGSPPRRVQFIAGPVAERTPLAFDPKAERIASVASDDTVRIWSVASGQELRVFRARRFWEADHLGFSPDGQFLVSTDTDHTAHLWDTTVDQGAIALRGGGSEVTDLGFAPRSGLLAACFADGKVGMWNASNGVNLWLLPMVGDRASALAFSPDGQQLAVAGIDGTVRLVHAESGSERQRFARHDRPVRAVAFHPEGRWIASASRGNPVLLWDPQTGDVIPALGETGRTANTLAFDPSGKRLAVGTQDHLVAVWDAVAATELWRRADCPAAVEHVAFSPDGEYVAVAHADGSVQILDAARGSSRASFRVSDPDQRTRVVFSPDGSRLVTVTRQRDIALWEVPTGQAVLTLCRDAGVAGAVAFHPDGKAIATGEMNGAIRLWQANLPVPPEGLPPRE
ncbi:MAG: WD40 repeat domain-containing protein, partial [Thermoguttaceae bacterium]|nr:WD40 repeat domain-containing protein [Thermoguttaceae bacterium]